MIEVGIKSLHGKECRYYVQVGRGQKGNNAVLVCSCPKQVYWSDGKDTNGKTQMARRQFATLAEAQQFQVAKQAELNGSVAPPLPTAPTGEPGAALSAPAHARNGNGTRSKTLRQAIVNFLEFKRNDYNKLTREKLSEGHVESRLRPLLANFLTFVNRVFAGVTESPEKLEDIQECNVLLSDIQPEHIIQFRNQLRKEDGSEYAQSTKAKLIDNLAGFFNTCIDLRYGITNSPVTDLAKVPPPDSQEPKALTDAQVEQFFKAIPQLPARSGDEVIPMLPAVLLLMRWTGLSVADAVMLERSAINPNGSQGFWKVETARAKTGKPVYCTITEDVAKKVLAGARATGKYLFVESVPAGEKERKALVAQWGRRISQLGELANIRDENGEKLEVTSHWMRHTFVRWCLDNNISTENIAMLIGDNVATVAKHYQTWIEGRQETLTTMMKAALKPKAQTATNSQ